MRIGTTFLTRNLQVNNIVLIFVDITLKKIDDLYAELEKYKGAQNESDSTGNI